MNEINGLDDGLRGTERSKINNNKTGVKSLRRHWSTRGKCLMTSPDFSLFVHLFILFMAESCFFLWCSCCFPCHLYYGIRNHPLPSLETLTPLWFIIPVNNLHCLPPTPPPCTRQTPHLRRTSMFRADSPSAGWRRCRWFWTCFEECHRLLTLFRATFIVTFFFTSNSYTNMSPRLRRESVTGGVFAKCNGNVFLYLHCLTACRDKSLDTFIARPIDHRGLLPLKECSTFVYTTVCKSIYHQTVI